LCVHSTDVAEDWEVSLVETFLSGRSRNKRYRQLRLQRHRGHRRRGKSSVF